MTEQPLLVRSDEDFMRIALREAEKAYAAGEVPVGAVIVIDGLIVARAHNQVELLKDATAHAEILAITQASAKLGDWRLQSATLYVTKEPCAMCSGALVNAKVGRCVFGMGDPRSGCCGGALNLAQHPGMLHSVQLLSGVLGAECLEMMQRFFRERRAVSRDTGG